MSSGRDIGIVGEGIGLELELGEESWDDYRLDLSTDSSAAKAFASRGGLGKIRHMEVKWLWLQGEVRSGRVVLRKVAGTRNPADVLTKYLGWREIEERLGWLGMELVRWAGPL